jgi:hypothetical protein
MKGVMNGDNGPHMPPPLTQQQYMNGQQMRAPPGPGYPPMPGQQPGPGGLGAYPQPAYQQPQQAKRLDPDQMPSPVSIHSYKDNDSIPFFFLYYEIKTNDVNKNDN